LTHLFLEAQPDEASLQIILSALNTTALVLELHSLTHSASIPIVQRHVDREMDIASSKQKEHKTEHLLPNKAYWLTQQIKDSVGVHRPFKMHVAVGDPSNVELAAVTTRSEEVFQSCYPAGLLNRLLQNTMESSCRSHTLTQMRPREEARRAVKRVVVGE
jgi:hypothetical protein